ncbi:hypothetical protein AKG12_21170 [Agrobacterium sp. SUL3]|nr:hypothetical protein AKG12_21170 [Agrobacterium sp. SUL3]
MPYSSSRPHMPSAQEVIETYRRLADDLETLGQVGPESIAPLVSVMDWTYAKRTVPIIIGEVLGHPHILDGTTAATTQVVYVDEHWQLARTINRWYRLGRPLIGGETQ